MTVDCCRVGYRRSIRIMRQSRVVCVVADFRRTKTTINGAPNGKSFETARPARLTRTIQIFLAMFHQCSFGAPNGSKFENSPAGHSAIEWRFENRISPGYSKPDQKYSEECFDDFCMKDRIYIPNASQHIPMLTASFRLLANSIRVQGILYRRVLPRSRGGPVFRASYLPVEHP